MAPTHQCRVCHSIPVGSHTHACPIGTAQLRADVATARANGLQHVLSDLQRAVYTAATRTTDPDTQEDLHLALQAAHDARGGL